MSTVRPVQIGAGEAALLEAAQGTDAPAWAATLRDAGRDAFAARGLPHRRNERWKWSDLRGRLGEDVATADAAAPDPVPGALVIDPWADEWPVLPDGLDVARLDDTAPDWARARLGALAAHDDDAIAPLNLSLFAPGLAIRVRRDVRIATPLELTGLGRGHVRVLLVLEDGASLDLIETLVPSAGFSTTVVEATVGANARLAHVRRGGPAEAGEAVALWALSLGRDAHWSGFVLADAPGFARHEFRVALGAPGGEAALAGVTAGRDSALADITTDFLHAAPHCASTQRFRAVLDGRARGVAQGRIIVAEGAQKTDAHFETHALLLARGAEADAKPELEIYADDVKCSHGATVGEIDRDQLFYLRARGIPEVEARALLVEAFLQAAFDSVPVEAARPVLMAETLRALGDDHWRPA